MKIEEAEINDIAKSQIDDIRVKCEQIKPLVVINCTTYNQEKYLREALNGFVMQKTNFPFVVVVHDDASTDETAKIIQEYAERYPDIIKPIYEAENQYSKKNGLVMHIMNAAAESTGAKYVAFCEGDDYWVDPLKLQKQVNFLEAHSDYTMSYTDAIRLYQETNKKKNLSCQGIDGISQLLRGNTITTATVVIRLDVLNAFYDSKIYKDLGNQKMGDYQIWLWAATKGKIHHIDEATTIYRVLQSSASHGSFSFWIKFLLSASIIKLRFAVENSVDATSIYIEMLLLELVLAYHLKEEEHINEMRCNLRKLPSCKLSRSNRIKISIAIRFPKIEYLGMNLRYKQEVSPSKIYVICQRIARKILKIK